MNNVENIYELSSMQEGILFYHLSEPEGDAYINQTVIEVEGDFDIEFFKRCCQDIISHYSTLRTSIVYKKLNNPMQVVLRNRELDFRAFDLSNKDAGMKKNDFINILEEDRSKGFNFVNDILIRFCVIKLDNMKYKVIITTSHIIIDGWSTSILLRDLFKIYSLRNSLQDNILKKTPPFIDYIKWLKSQDNDRAKEFWKQYLHGVASVPLIPTYRDKKGQKKDSYKEIEFVFRKDIFIGLESISTELGVTLPTILQTIWGIILQRYNNTDDIVFGNVTSGRAIDINDIENMFGLFINTMPVRINSNDKTTFKELVKDTFENMISCQKYGYLPLSEIQKCANLDKKLDHIFVYENYPVDKFLEKQEELQKIGINIRSIEAIERSDYNFGITFIPGESLKLKINYNESTIDSNIINYIYENIDYVCQMVIGDYNINISDIEVITEEQKRKLLYSFNDTNAEWPKESTIISLFEEQVIKTPDRKAIEFGSTSLTYEELNCRANRLAQRLLLEDKENTNKTVCLMVENSIESIVGILAILKAGMAYLPINSELPYDRVTFILKDSHCKLLLTKKSIVDKLKLEIGIKAICLDDESNYIGKGENLNVKCTPMDAAYIIYTSGSTGKPKGVIVDNKNVVRLLFNNRNIFDFNENDVWTLFHSTSFDFSVWEIYGALLYGGLLVIVPESIRKDPAKYLRILKEKMVTVLNQTPKYFYTIMHEELKNKDNDLKLRYIIFGGEALNPNQLMEWRKKYNSIKLINMYGITETTVHVTYKEIKEVDIENGLCNIGMPLPTTKVYILDKNLRLMPLGSIGEICVSGLGVSKGYLYRDDLTKEKFVSNPYCSGEKLYRSGDLGRLLPNGEIEYLGRMDSQVKIRGFRIELGEIESVLLMHKEIKEAVVVDIFNDGKEENNLCAYVNTGNNLSAEDLRPYLAKFLPSYMIPAYFIEVNSIPLTSNGKINRTALPKLTERILKKSLYVCPANEIEKKVSLIWEDVLNSDNIGVTDNFFALGGDSLKVIRIVSRMNSELNLDLQVADVFQRQTIRELLKTNKDSSNDNTISKQWSDGMSIINKLKEEVLSDFEIKSKLPQKYEDIYPLTPIENGMIYSSLINMEEPVYYDQVVYKVKINDINIFKEALSKLIMRHGNLRTLYYSIGFSKPIKVVLDNIDAPLSIEDISSFGEDIQRNKIKEYLSLDLGKRYKFDGDLLWNLKAYKVEDYEYYLILSFHHAMLDGWSKSTLLIELTKYVSLIERNSQTKISCLKNTYKDYCAIELGKNITKETGDFWRNTLKGYSRTSLPFNANNRLKSKSAGIRLINKKFDKDLSDKVLNAFKVISADNNVTLKSIYLSAFLYLLHVCSFEDDIVSGVVSHARPEIEDADKILGCFLKTIPIRINVGDADNFLNLIKMVNNFLISVKPHEIHLTDIMKEIGENTTTLNPIFDMIFNFTDFHVRQEWDYDQSIFDSGVTISEGELSGTEMTNTLFDLELDKTLDSLYIQIKYSTAYFEEYDAKYFLELYIRVLELIANDVNKRLKSSDLLNEEEKEFLIKDFNNTVSDYSKDKTLDLLFEERVSKAPNSIALRMSDKSMTFLELNNVSNKLARHLVTKGIKVGDTVGLVASRDFNMIIGMLSILKVGAAYVPIDPKYPYERQNYIFKNSNIQKVLMDKPYNFIDEFNNDIETININEVKLIEYDSSNLNIKKSSKELAYIIYTSGSTGNPKGVSIEHHSAVNLIEWVNFEFNINDRDSLLFLTSMCFDLSVYDIFGILAAGATLVFALEEDIQDADKLKRLLEIHEITIWDSVPSTMNHLVNFLEVSDERYKQDKLRLVLLSGDWIPVSLPDKVKYYFENAKVISLGGATEGTIWSNYYKITKVDPFWASIPYGKPIKNNFFYILDKELNMVPIGAVGNLYIGGVGVARGYINDIEKNQNSFLKDPFNQRLGGRMYYTGDLGRMMPDGNMEFLGRKDYQIKVRGYRVELGEIENQLMKYPGVKEAVVVSKEDKGIYLCAYICGDYLLNKSEIKSYLLSKLPSYMIPAYIVQLDKLPLTANGKIERKNLPAPEEKIKESFEDHYPQNREEEIILNIWREILPTKFIGTHDNFFDIGGDSLKATELISKINKRFQVKVPLKEVFERQTIKDLANYLIEKDIEDTEDLGILPIKPLGR